MSKDLFAILVVVEFHIRKADARNVGEWKCGKIFVPLWNVGTRGVVFQNIGDETVGIV